MKQINKKIAALMVAITLVFGAFAAAGGSEVATAFAKSEASSRLEAGSNNAAGAAAEDKSDENSADGAAAGDTANTKTADEAGASEDKDAAFSRLSVSETKVWMSTTTKIKVTLRGRAAGEEVIIKQAKTDIVKVVPGKCDGDTLTLKLKIKGLGTDKFYVKFGGESIRVNVVVVEKREKTAEEIYSDTESACVEFDCFDKYETEYIGAGFFIGESKILTNYHVIESAAKMTITDYSGKKYTPYAILAYDEGFDLAVVGVKEKNKNALVISKDDYKTGDTVYTIGSPYGYTGTFSMGIISLAERKMDGYKYIQMTAATSQGSGGGPLLNTKGEVIGINTLTVKAAQNLNFALHRSYISKLDYAAPIAIEDFYRGTGDKTYQSSILYANEKRTNPGIGVLSAIQHDPDEGEELTAQQVYENSRDAMVEIKAETAKQGNSTGSGFFISGDVILTNFHVISGAVNLTITDYSGKTYKAKCLESWDVTIDMALLRVETTEEHSWLQIDTDYVPATGETIYNLGSPYWYTGTFAKGIVSMTESYLDGITYTQVEAPMYSGSSGGPLINKYGRVIGINTAAFLSAQKVNFSLKISYIYELSRKEVYPIESFYAESKKKAA